MSLDLLSESVADFEASPQNLFAQNAVTRNPVTELLIDRDAHTEITHHFSASLRSPESLGLELIPANQFSTGRCWLFAMMNTIRLPLVKKLNLPLTFELSQSYMMFWDKVERTNFFLETMIETADEPFDSRLIQWLCSQPVSDGGQWDMCVNLILKHGVMPQECFPETFSSSASARMNYILTNSERQTLADFLCATC